MTSSQADEYALGRTAEESKRLNTQHALITKTLTYLLHPHITSGLPQDAKIADIGAGTAIFLIDLAAILPSTCTLIGYDISSAQYPSPSSLPANISLRLNSILSPFPTSEQGTYDVVTVRFMTTVLTGTEWDTAFTNLLSLLKPSGWLQWIDVDGSQATIQGRVYQSVPGATRKACVEICDAMAGFEVLTKRELDGCKRLKNMFVKQGMSDVIEELWNLDRLPELRGEFGRCHLVGMKMLFEALCRIPGTGRSWESAERLIGEAEREIREGGLYHSVDVYVVIGRKGL